MRCDGIGFVKLRRAKVWGVVKVSLAREDMLKTDIFSSLV
jgi:hypothetical protein